VGHIRGIGARASLGRGVERPAGAGMMLNAQPQPKAQLQLEAGGSCILPSLSNVLLAMRTPKHGDEASAAAAAAQSEMWSHVQQLNAQLSAQHMNMWGASSLLALSQAHGKASAHGTESLSTTDSAPASPGENTSEDEKPPGRHAAAGVKSSEPAQPAAPPAAARRDAPAGELKSGTPAGAGSQYWPGRRWRERRDKKYDGDQDSRQSAHLQVAVLGLQKALNAPAKAKLLEAMRQYLDGVMTPERFAEAIKELVDQHNVIVPTGVAAPAVDAASRKRALGSEQADHAAPAAGCSTGRPGRSRDGKRSKNRGTHLARSSPAHAPGPAPGAEVEERESSGADAWNALVSVCSML